MVASRSPGTPISKIQRTPTLTPGGSSKSALTPGGSSKSALTPGGSSKSKEEKIFVTVRVRPLSKKELAVKDQTAWECADSQTIIYKPPPQDRAAPTSYTFDKVFGPSCQTDLVYEDGAKDVAMSALKGINATIFAYGQTSSGKTYTMRGVTECAVSDIYRHMENNPEREFVIKISAMEIYNEIVKDLLQPDSGPLRLLDDPEKGPIVEKLDEQIAKDREHLRHLIGICEEQRQVGETALNDTSSRSHQIIRLTVESRLREVSGCLKSFVASLNFVDLAGSERAAQTHAIGARLKEGCHINRSLLTLTKVIRKLSSEKRSGHIPYRDSKLTRILQLSLGGNARTAIICTMSPALTHVEQSKNTLFFATCAKEVTNTAKVNMVVSDKQLVKHLQTEVARLEADLRTADRSCSSEVLIMEKDMKIKQMEIEMEELKKERDNACSQLKELRNKMGDNQQEQVWDSFDSSQKARKCLTFSGSLQPSKMSKIRNSIRQSSTAPLMLKHEIRKIEQLQQQLEVEANRAIEVLHKEVECHKHGNQDVAETIAKLQAEIREMKSVRPENRDVEMITDEGNGSDLKDEISRLHMQDNDIAKLEAKLENVQRSIDKLVMSLPNVGTQCNESSTKSNVSKKKRRMFLPLGVSNINRPIRAPCSPHSSGRPSESEVENRAPDGHTVSHEDSAKATPSKSEDTGDISSRDGTPRNRRSSSVNMKKMQRMFQNAAEENVRSIRDYVTELKERVAKLQYQKQLLVCQVLELESNEAKPNDMQEDPDENGRCLQDGPESHRLFKEQMHHIIQLWDLCHVSIIHRTQFYLLFKGDTADQIYIEVEVRRLLWLQQHLDEVDDAAPGDDLAVSRAASMKALRNEREFLARRMGSRLEEEERERLFIKWQVPLEAKQRKLQLVNKLWTDPKDQVHIEESADIVARLVGFCEGGNVSKEMFELNFAVPSSRRPWLMGWQPISNMIRERAQLW